MRRINLRAEAMWEHISAHVNFQNKYVIDIGAGHCDLAMMAVDAGAHTVVCVEKVEQVYESSLERLEFGTYSLNINLIHADAEKLLYGWLSPLETDIAICTSVLPYLKNPEMMLGWMSGHAKTSIIEMQYVGDGPGDKLGIENDSMMEEWLSAFWHSIEKIGETKIGIRPGTRSIWACRRQKKDL